MMTPPLNKKSSPAARMSLASKEARGTRLRELRELTGPIAGKPLSRAVIERKYGLSARTLKNWEYGHGGGLTEGGARRVINIYQKENIQCSIPWLMQGVGRAPERPLPLAYQGPATTTDPLNTMTTELQYFQSLHPESMSFEVKDDAMAPFYLPGDVVAGVRYYAHDIAKLINHDCIIEIKIGEMWIRRLQNSTVPGQYNLYALNPNTTIERPTLYAVEILTAAPIIRHWRGKKWAGR